MKIAIITSGILPVPAYEGGAVETLIDYFLLENALTGQHEFTVFSIVPKPDVQLTQTKHTRYVYISMNTFLARLRRQWHVRVYGSGYYNYFINDFYLSVRRRLLREHWDAIILENRAGLALDLRRHTDCPIILHQHQDSLNPETEQAAEICHCLTHVIGVSDYICRRVREIGTSVPTTTVHNGIDISHFATAASARRSDFGIADDAFLLVFSGRIDPIKGIGELIEAVTLLRDTPRLHLLVIGGSFFGNTADRDSEFLRQLRQKAEPVRDRIHFTGFVPYAQVPSLMKMADLAVMPSIWQEAFQLTVIEAMAAGIPVLTTNSGAVPETSTGVACILPQGPGLPERLAQAIAKLMADPATLQKMTEAGRQRVQNFTHTAYAKAFLDILPLIVEPKS